MRQLQLFTTAQLAVMRDRTKARNYSAEGDAFAVNMNATARGDSPNATPGSGNGCATVHPAARRRA